jgi:SAM-dependent methyltransferase
MTDIPCVRDERLLDRIIARMRYSQAERIIREEQKVQSVLDVGCGKNGTFLRRLNVEKKCGLDWLSEQKEYEVEGIRFFHTDLNQGRHFPFEDGRFDIVTMLAVIEHIELVSVLAVLKEIRRVLRPQGSLILTTPTPTCDKLCRILANLGLISKKEIEEHKTAYPIRQVKTRLLDAGFGLEGITAGYFECCLNIWAKAVK